MASTKHGGYSSKAAQSSALASAMRASQAKYPGAWAKAGTTANKLLQQKAANQARAQQQQQRINLTPTPKITFTKPNFSKTIKPNFSKPVKSFIIPISGGPNDGLGMGLGIGPKEAKIRYQKSIANKYKFKQNRQTSRPVYTQPTPQQNPKPRIEITNLQGKEIKTGDYGIRRQNGLTDIVGIDKRSPAYKNLMQGDVLLKGMTNTSKNSSPGVSTLGQMAITDNYSLGGPRNLVSRRNTKPLPIKRQQINPFKDDELEPYKIPFNPLAVKTLVTKTIKRKEKVAPKEKRTLY